MAARCCRSLPALLMALLLLLLLLVHRAGSSTQLLHAPRLPFEVEWRVPVGCDFSGFFTEVRASAVTCRVWP